MAFALGPMLDTPRRVAYPSANFSFSNIFQLNHYPFCLGYFIIASRMSFRFRIGDFITIFDHANKLRKDFVAALAQFKAIFDE